MRPRTLAEALWNRLPLPFGRLAVAVEEEGAGGAPAGDPPLNKVCDRRDWQRPGWLAVCRELGFHADPAALHRKPWEFTQAVHGLRRLRALAPDAEALGIGSGHEPVIYFLARRLARVVATDLYGGAFGAQEAHPRMLADPESYAPHAYPRERLEVRRMDAAALDFPDGTFDLVFSFSSIEHFGPLRSRARALAEAARVLRPGGVAAITTEIVLNRWGRIDDGFTRAELLGRLVPGSGLELAGDGFDFTTSRGTLADPIRFPEELGARRAHLVMRRRNTLFTSCALFLRKPAPPGTPPERLARTGEERPASLPPLLAATIRVLDAPAAVRCGDAFSLRCRVQNTGTGRWARAFADGVGTVRLGARLAAADGGRIEPDYGRADLPGDLPPGGTAEVELRLVAPRAPGSCRVELDMVREGVTWFSDQEGGPAVALPLRVA